MNIIVKVDDELPIVVKSGSDLESIVLYSDWKEIHMFDLDEIREVKK